MSEKAVKAYTNLNSWALRSAILKCMGDEQRVADLKGYAHIIGTHGDSDYFDKAFERIYAGIQHGET